MWGGRRSGDGDGVSNGNEGGRSQRRLRRRNDTIRAEESGGGAQRRHYNTVSGAQAVSGADTSSCQLEAISEN